MARQQPEGESGAKDQEADDGGNLDSGEPELELTEG
ncbi:Uncharacterised protein [Mycobacterium tuberculosis]|nr:Uncharacterised protein [Mycobacterium tuberculosis]